MSAILKQQARVIVCDGNEAAAWAVAASRVDLVAVFPITPQSSLAEYLATFVADGRLDAELVDVEGEHSVLSVLHGACLAGARTYTASCGQGLAFMFEPYVRTPGLRLPIVMGIVTRDYLSPQCVWGGQQDAMSVREAGWIQLYCESVQEVLDTTVMAYKIAEHHDVMLPVNVCHDGNYLSYGATRMEMLDQDEVDHFLGEKNVNWHVALDPERPMAVDPLTGGATGAGPAMFVRYRRGQCSGTYNALRVITEVHDEWERRFGRRHAPLIEQYRMTDAKYAIMTIGSMTGVGKDAVDAARERGELVGLVKIKTFRPFPKKQIATALSTVNAVGVVDRSVSFGFDCGPLFQDVVGAIHYAPRRIPAMSFIGGLAGADITLAHFDVVIRRTAAIARGEAPGETVWLNECD